MKNKGLTIIAVAVISLVGCNPQASHKVVGKQQADAMELGSKDGSKDGTTSKDGLQIYPGQNQPGQNQNQLPAPTPVIITPAPTPVIITPVPTPVIVNPGQNQDQDKDGFPCNKSSSQNGGCATQVPVIVNPAQNGVDCLAKGGCTPVIIPQYGEACQAAFLNHGIAMPNGLVYKQIDVGVSVLGSGNAISDLQTTIQPVMTILVGVSVLSNVEMLLLNRNAYYCVAVNVGVLSQVTVQRACSAQFTGVNVNVNVLGNMNELPCVP